MDTRENGGSEVARLRRRMELECEALKRAMGGFAIVASHEAIMQRYERLGVCREELGNLIGENDAEAAMCEVYNRVVG
ncbi:MAG: hypothetical protein ABI413_04800 [Ktedonobacteraceae bacterium]